MLSEFNNYAGASPHTAISTHFLPNELFPNKVIAHHFDKLWPPYSPDLTPADFYLWSTLKRIIYSDQTPYLSIPTMKRAITFNIKKLSSSRDLGFFARLSNSKIEGTCRNLW